MFRKIQLLGLVLLLTLLSFASIATADSDGVAPCCAGGSGFSVFEIIFIAILLVVVLFGIYLLFKHQEKYRD